MNKVSVSTVITFILGLWELIKPTAEVIFGIGTKGMAITALIVTALTYAYDYFFAKESIIKTAVKRIGGELPEEDDEEGGI